MNKKSEFQTPLSSLPVTPIRSRRAGRPPARHSQGRTKIAPTLGEPLSREASRLLSALAGPETEALLDPTEDGFVMVRRRQGKVTVGAGRFSFAAADSLARHDLAHWNASRALRVTGAGRAHQRRRDADS